MKKIPLVFLFAACLFLTFSCEMNNNANDGSINVVNVSASALIAPDGIDPAARTAALGANDFAFRLSADLIKNIEGKNFVFSPYSVWMPLAALVNATDPQYKDALITALGASGIAQDDINRAASRMLYDLTNVRDEGSEWHYNPLRIANAIFVDHGETLRRGFAQTFMDFYRGNSINVDFSSRDAVDAVNRWAERNTEGLIKNLIKEFDPTTIIAIANAIYFSDQWAWEFSPQQTEEGVFRAPGGNTTASFMLRQGSGQTYYEDERLQAMPLWFTNGGGLYILLPKTGGAEDLLSSMTNAYFTRIQENSFSATGKLLLPRFSIENDIKDLKESLITLGVPLFEGGPITGLTEGPYPVFLNDAIHRALIKVDEKGTTAAAVTVLPGSNGSAGPGDRPPDVPFEMICDKPFVFILYDRTYDGGSQILFTGIVNQP